MTANGFEQLVKVQLDKLQSSIVAEHRLALEVLETRIAALEVERHFQQKPSAQREEHLCSSLGGGCTRVSTSGVSCASGDAAGGCGDAVLSDADAEQCTVSGVSLPVLLPSAVVNEPPSSAPTARSSRTAERLAIIRVSTSAAPSSRRGSNSSDDEPVSGDSAQYDGRASYDSSCTASKNFKVLDIWDKPRVGMSSRRVSVQSIDRMSSASRSTSTFFTNSAVDELEASERSAQNWLEGRLALLMLPPSSLRHLCWELMSLVLVAIDFIIIPLQIFFSPRETTFKQILSWSIRLFWTVDIFVSFLTGYVSPQGLVEMRPAKVALKYVRKGLFFDVLLVGCDWVEAIIAVVGGEQGSENASVLQPLGMLRPIRLIRLVRLIKTQKIWEYITEHIRSEGVKLIAYMILLIIVLLCLVHVIACLWHGIRETANAVPPEGCEYSSPEGDVMKAYSLAFHQMLALFTAGEHVVTPRNGKERAFTIVVLLFAFLTSGIFVGLLTTAMTRLQMITSKRSTQFAVLNRYLSDYSISRELAARVQRNARHALKEQKRHTPESSVELMALISDPLKSEIHYEVNSPILNVHPFFYLYNSVNPVGVRHICHTAVSSVSLSRGDVIFSEFEVAVVPRMFFVISGRLAYIRGMESQQNVVAMQWVAEAVLWTRWAHRGTLRAHTECRLLALDAHRLANIMSTFPTCHGINYAMRFVESLNQVTNSAELTDISESTEQARSVATSIFLELDRQLEVPSEWRSTSVRRISGFSMASYVSARRRSFGSSRRTSVMTVVPTGAD